MKKVQKGFTLIELMIVIAIIGILAAIAIPQYQDYVTRSKITEGLNLSEAAKTAVAETVQSLGGWGSVGNAASGSNSYGLPLAASIAGKYVTSVTVTPGANPGPSNTLVTIVYNAPAVGGGVVAGSDTLVLTAATSPGGVIWACGNTKFTAGGVTVDGTASGTTVSNKFLPANCRG